MTAPHLRALGIGRTGGPSRAEKSPRPCGSTSQQGTGNEQAAQSKHSKAHKTASPQETPEATQVSTAAAAQPKEPKTAAPPLISEKTDTRLIYMEGLHYSECCGLEKGKIRKIAAAADGVAVVLVLEETIFHPQGGGQATDEGLIKIGDGSASSKAQFEVMVTMVSKCKVTGNVLHAGTVKGSEDERTALLAAAATAETTGTPLSCTLHVNKALRIRNSRLHAAGHFLDAAVAAVGGGLKNWTAGKGYHFLDGPYVEYIMSQMPGDKEFVNAFEHSGSDAAKGKDALVAALQDAADKLLKSEVEDTSGNILQKGAVGPNTGAPGEKWAYDSKVFFDEELRERPPAAVDTSQYVKLYLPDDPQGRSIERMRTADFGGVKGPCGGTHLTTLGKIGRLKLKKLVLKKDRARVTYEVEGCA